MKCHVLYQLCTFKNFIIVLINLFSNSFLQANEVLLAGKKLTAEEALDRNLLTKVIPDASFEKVIEEKLEYLASLPPMVLVFKILDSSYIY